MFIRCDRRTAAFCWAVIVGSSLLIIVLALWIALHRDMVLGHPALTVAAVAVGLYLGDLATGVFHWTFDTWFDEHCRFPRAVLIAREHHSHPSHILRYPFRDYVGFSAAPALFLVGPFSIVLMLVAPGSDVTGFALMSALVVLTSMFFASHTHALGHRHARTRFGRLLQRAHLILSPAVHRRHHHGTHTTHYCALNGWANPLCDRLRIWRALERAIGFVTGAEPRRHDRRWMAEMAAR
jgi:hypothetical protein